MTNVKCKKCKSSKHVKSGFVRGHQRYKCKECGYQFTATKIRGVDPALKSLAIVLYAYCGVSMGKIARIFKVSTVAVLKWVRSAALEIKEPSSTTQSNIVMIDEMWHFVNGKKTKFGSGEPLMGHHVRLSDGTSAIVVIQAPKS